MGTVHLLKGTEPRPALFLDFDGTFTRQHTIFLLLKELGSRYRRIGEILSEMHDLHARYKRREISYDQINQWLRVRFLNEKRYVGISKHDLELAAWYVHEKIGTHLHLFTKYLIHAAHACGMPVFVITGTFHEIAEVFLENYPITEIVATRGTFDADECMTVSFAQDPVQMKGEALCVLAHNHDIDLKGSVAMGDTLTDAAMFEHVGHPVCFMPDAALLQKAREHDWPVVLEMRQVLYAFRDRQEIAVGTGLPTDLYFRIRDALSEKGLLAASRSAAE